MERKQEVSKAVIQRLPRYYRNICELKAEGVQRISSRSLAERMGLTASQIRQDFNCFGGFGQQGYGYNINPELKGRAFGGYSVRSSDDLPSFIAAHKPDVAVLTIPRSNAPEIAQQVVSQGVRGLWNFTGEDLHLGGLGVPVENVHLSDSLMTLCHLVSTIEE